MRRIEDPSKLAEKTAYYFPIVLDMIVGALNSDNKFHLAGIDEQFIKYRGDFNLVNMGQIITEEFEYAKKTFLLAGFDIRVKYKLVSRQIHKTNMKMWAIVMDLEETVEHFNKKQPETNVESMSDAVITNPTLDQLAELYNYQ
jgi:hypothetical protein